MRDLRQGDTGCLDVLFRRHASRVYTHCLRLVGDPDEARDLTQDAFLRVLRHRHTFRGDAAFGTWLYRIVRNACLNRRRADASRRAREALAAHDQAACTDPRVTPDGERWALVLRALGALDADARELISLTRLGGIKPSAAADLLGITPGAARVRLHRALVALRHEVLKLEGTTE
jgi:RNA polymerase sigma-70 factor, ECF subfamily